MLGEARELDRTAAVGQSLVSHPGQVGAASGPLVLCCVYCLLSQTCAIVSQGTSSVGEEREEVT